MPTAKPSTKPTLADLKARGTIPPDVLAEIEQIAVRLIQIQDETKTLETEKGYTDWEKKRHPGIQDRLEDLFVAYSIPGIKLEDFIVYPSNGSNTRIDPLKLLDLGVTPDQISAATVESHWTSVVCRRV